MLSALLALAAPAFAASNEVSFEVGWITAADPAFDYFARGDMLASYGLRVGYAVHDNVAVIAGWQHAVNGGDVGIPALRTSYWAEEDYEYGYEDAFQVALYTDQISVGGKADVKVWKWLHPYVSAQVVGMRGLARLDDDARDEENVTQVQVAGLTGGFTGAAGLDILIRIKGDVYLAPYLELGYGWIAPMKLKNLGSVQFGGYAGRTGVGVRF